MPFEYSKHWEIKRRTRSEITLDILEYCIIHSAIIKDKNFSDVLNAITKIPPSGRTLKVVYKIKGKTIKIITAFWLN
jgi:hypothetical protein